MTDDQHTAHKSEDDREFWLTCDGKEFARLTIDPALTSPALGAVEAFFSGALRAHREVAHG